METGYAEVGKTYGRVLPRDLFNEAKLLKCLGKLALLIHDGQCGRLTLSQLDGGRFLIEQDPSDGSFYVANLAFFLGEIRVHFCTGLNSQGAWPLLATIDSVIGELEVFHIDGSLTYEFMERVT